MMDICTYHIFRSCIRNPKLHLRTLDDIVFDETTVACTEHFVECEATIFDCRVMTYAPLSLDAIHYANHAMEVLAATNGDLGNFKVVKNEILLNSHFASTCSLIIETLPQGTLLSEAIYTFSQEHLLQGLKNLKQRLLRHNVCHTNLTPDNIIVDSNYEWHPIRWYYAVKGKRKDYKAFKLLAERIHECSIPERFAPTLDILSHNNNIEYPGKRFPLRERRRRVITENGTGFKDELDNWVIEDIYRHATDFTEDRAIVTLKSGHKGIINRSGKYIIPPVYDKILFDTNNGESKAYNGLELTLFDYLGAKIMS